MSGNGYAAQTPLPGPIPNRDSNFGIGVFGTDNEIVDNIVVGNANGIILFANVTPPVTGNTVRKNLVVGNPPVQISVNNPATTGVDIRNDAPPGSNIIEDNVCLTAVNAACPDVDDTPPRAR